MNAEEIFHQALAQPEHERQPFLDSVLAGHPEIRAEVEALLAAHGQAGDFLERPLFRLSPPGTLNADLVPAETMLGPFRLLQVIGRGGMGVVYLAEQKQPVARQVAVKVIHAGTASRSVLARFEAERTALALMDHPNIARVLDAGATDDGLPWIAMELVRGLPITQYCDRARLNPRQRLELLVTVCHAVQHAHQKGIIHRDLKPSNVLVTEYDGRPVPKVIDFGVAKAVGRKLQEETLYTDFGSVIGTLEYMSPEQAGLNQLDIDTRSDVYSLGVILYELLTGTTPLDRRQLEQAGVLELLQKIREDDPLRPSQRITTAGWAPSASASRSLEPARLTGLLRGDLDWITMKSLEKDRARRYQTASDLAADLQRYLHDEPVFAGPPSATYRIRKFLRRNRLAAALSACALVALIGGVVGTSIGMIRARQERDQKDLALREVERERDQKSEALAAEQRARAAADAATDRAVEALTTLTDDAVDRLLATQPELSAANREFLSRIIAQLERFSATSDDSRRARALHASSLNQIGNLKGRLGDHAGAIAAFRQAIGLWEQLTSEFPGQPEYRRGLGDVWNNLGMHLVFDRDVPGAIDAHRRSVEIQQALASEFPDNRGYQTNLANCRIGLGVALKELRQHAEATEQYREAITIYQSQLLKWPDDAKLLRNLGNARNNLAIELSLAGRHDESVAAFEELIALRDRLCQLPDSTPDEAWHAVSTKTNLALVLRQLRRTEESLAWLEKAEPEASRIVSEFPAVYAYRDGYSQLLDQLANTYSRINRLPEGIAVARRGLAITAQLVREFPDRSDLTARGARFHASIAVAQMKAGDPAASRAAFAQAITDMEQASERAPNNADYRFQLANYFVASARVHEELNDPDAARDSRTRARELLDAMLERDPADQRAQNLLDSLNRRND